jgi:hypothetical protein
MYYLAYARHITHQSLRKPGDRLNNLFPSKIQRERKDDPIKKKSRPKMKSKNAHQDVDSDQDENCPNENSENDQQHPDPVPSKMKNRNNTQATMQTNPVIPKLLDEFYLRSPQWGGQFNGIHFSNTCSIDYM